MTVSHWHETSDGRKDRSHEIVIIGSGLIGTYMANLLNDKDIALVDKNFPAAGASGRNAGMVLLGMRDTYVETIRHFGHNAALEIWRLTETNVNQMRKLAQKHDVEYEDIGTYYFGGTDESDDDLRKSTELLERDNFNATFLKQDPLGRGFGCAAYHPDDFATHPAKLTHKLSLACNATMYENQEVFSIEQKAHHLQVKTRNYTINCDKVMLAVNGYAGLIDPYFLPFVEPARGQVLLTNPAPRFLNKMCMHNRKCYYRQLPNGQLLVGGGRWQNIIQENTWEDRTTDNVKNYINDFINTYFSEAAEVGISREWSGIHGMTPDGLPILGKLPHNPKVYFCVGFSGHGNSIGLMASQRALELMIDDVHPGVLSVDRLI